MGLEAGKRIGSYELRRPLGRGSTGQVWAAVLHGSHGFRRLVALKLLDGEVDPRRRDTVLREARLGGLVHHPNVVPALEVGEADGRWFIAMELVRGVPVSELRGRIGPWALVDLAVQACAALQQVHDLTDIDGNPVALSHRDLRPTSLLVDASGGLRLLDVGVADLLGPEGQPTGTFGYAAPEQHRGEGSQASDIFSLGLVLVRLATGLRPLGGDPSKLVRVARYMEDPELRVALDDFIPGLASVVLAAVQQHPGDRYPSATAFAAALQRLRVPVGETLADCVSTLLPDEGDMTLEPAPPRLAAVVGRDLARAAVADRLLPGVVVVVTGPAGVGKTTLVDAVAADLTRPSLRCDLGGVRDAEGVIAAIAGVLELRGFLDVAGLGGALRGRGDVVLVLDGVEGVAKPLASVLDELMPHAPEASVLCASRVSVPAASAAEARLGKLTKSAARLLLRARCPITLKDREVAQLLKKVGELPLAVELAACAVGADGVEAFLDAMAADGSKRRSTLERVLHTAWERLPADARDDLTRLCAFAGAFDLDAAAAVFPLVGSPVARLERLTRFSMVQVRGSQFRLLPTVRAFVARQGDAEAKLRGQQAHGHWFARLGARGLVAGSGITIEHALHLRESLDDLLLAQELAVSRGDEGVAVACTLALAPPLLAQGRQQTVVELVESVWLFQRRRPELAMRRGLALTLSGRAEDAERELRDAHIRCREPALAGRYARFRSLALRALGRSRDAIEVLERSWPAQELAGDPRFVDTVGELGRCLLAAGRPWEADTYLARALEGSRRDIGRCVYRSASSQVHMFMGSFDDAIAGFQSALADQETLGLVTTSLGSRAALAVSCWLSGRPADALDAAERLLVDADRVGFAEDVMMAQVLLAHAHVELGDHAAADKASLAAFEALPSRDHRQACEVWLARAAVCWVQGREDEARTVAVGAPDVPESLGWESTVADHALQLARFGMYQAARRKLERLEDARNPWRYARTTAMLAQALVDQARGRDPSDWLTSCDERLRGMQWGSQRAPLLRVRRAIGSG